MSVQAGPTRWALTIEYDGASFSGWQRQASGIPSVQGAVEDAFRAFCQQDLTLHVAGRTDAGVHALGQVAHVDLDYGGRDLSGYDLANALNAHLRPAAVSVLEARAVPPDFHARFSAVGKLYTYRILNRPAPPCVDRGRVWHVRGALDAAAMRAAARPLLGHHDFTSFRDSECQAKSPMRTVDRLDIETRPSAGGGQEILIHAEGRSFLHHQVRNMAGTLVLAGKGRLAPDGMREILEARDRTKGGQTAPAEGLYLVRVDYPK